MDNEAVGSLVRTLDTMVPREGALIRATGFFTEDDHPSMTGNRLGYLRMGIELMKIADLPPEPNRPERVRADLAYLIDPNDACGEFASFERRENLRLWAQELAVQRTSRLDVLGMLMLSILGLLLVASVSVGLWDVFRWMLRLVGF
jgi:hypothetical protein